MQRVRALGWQEGGYLYVDGGVDIRVMSGDDGGGGGGGVTGLFLAKTKYDPPLLV